MERENANNVHHRNKAVVTRKDPLHSNALQSIKGSTRMPSNTATTHKGMSRKSTTKRASQAFREKKSASLSLPSSSAASTASTGTMRSRLTSENTAHRTTIELLQNLTSIIVHTRNVPVLPDASVRKAPPKSTMVTEGMECSIKEDQFGSNSSHDIEDGGNMVMEDFEHSGASDNMPEYVSRIDPTQTSSESEFKTQRGISNVGGATVNNTATSSVKADSVMHTHSTSGSSAIRTFEICYPDSFMSKHPKQSKVAGKALAAGAGEEAVLCSQLRGDECTTADRQPHVTHQRIPQVFNYGAPQGFKQRSHSRHKELSSSLVHVADSQDPVEASSGDLDSPFVLASGSSAQATGTSTPNERSDQDWRETVPPPPYLSMDVMKQTTDNHSLPVNHHQEAEPCVTDRQDSVHVTDESVSEGVVALSGSGSEVAASSNGGKEGSLQGGYWIESGATGVCSGCLKASLP